MATLSPKLPWELANPRWAAVLNPIISNPLLQGNLITNIILNSGGPPVTFNHLLGRMPVGWFVVDLNSPDAIYRTQPFNESTLTLQSNGSATVNVWVF